MEYRVRKRNVDGSRRWRAQAKAARGRRAVAAPSMEVVLSDTVVRRFLLRAGFRMSSTKAADVVRKHVSEFFQRIVGCMVAMMQSEHRRDFRLVDVKRACEHYGIKMYGYDDTCLLASGGRGGPQEFHVTELVECNTVMGRAQDADDEPETEPGARFQKTDFVANYSTWENDADEMSEASEWSYSVDGDSDTSVESDEDEDQEADPSADVDMETGSLRPWQSGPTDEAKFLESLRAAQADVDDQLLCQEPEAEKMDGDVPPGQGYFSDYDDVHEPEYVAEQQANEQGEDALWNTYGELQMVESDKTSSDDLGELLDSGDDANLYVISRQEFLDVFRAHLQYTLCLGELSISSVALSALHNATEQCLHRSLTEGSLHFQLKVLLREQEYVSSTNELEAELQVQHEKVNELCTIISDQKAAFQAKELEMQQQIAQLKQQLQVQQPGKQDLDNQASTTVKKAPGKRKITSKKTSEVVRKGVSKSSSSSTTIAGALRSRVPNRSVRKKTKVNHV